LAVNEDIGDDEAHMLALSNIERLNKNAINPDLDDLLKHVRLAKSHLDLIISDLFKMGYIDSESNVSDYHITEKGINILERYRSQVKHFAWSIKQLYDNNQKDALYTLLMQKKDLLWFAYYERLITKNEIQNIAKKLDASIPRIWWDKSIQHMGSDYQY
jgi:predicted transcriptional regulator